MPAVKSEEMRKKGFLFKTGVEMIKITLLKPWWKWRKIANAFKAVVQKVDVLSQKLNLFYSKFRCFIQLQL